MNERVLKAVIVGCGGISRAWMESIRKIPGLEVAGFVDLNLPAARKLAEDSGFSRAPAGTDMKDMLERVRPDAVFNLTVPEAHEEVTVDALRAGCHVLSEKPLADGMESARRMVKVAAETGKTFAVIQNRRYDKRIRRLKRFLESGVLGRIGTVYCDFVIGAHFGGFRDRMRHVLLLDMAIHTFDAARFLIGQDPVSVLCREWNPPGSWYDQDASAAAFFEMAGECMYVYRGTWCAEGLNTTWECDWRIIGENGSVKWDGADGFRVQTVEKRGGFFSKWRDADADAEVPAALPEDKDGGHAGNIGEFVECIRNGGVPETEASDNIKSLAMVFGAIESADAGAGVTVRW